MTGMSSGRTPLSLVHVSLREMLLALAFVALACASLKYAGEVWWMVLSATALVGFLAAAVVAVVARGRGQAQAIGFVLCVAIYAVLILSTPSVSSDRVPKPDPFGWSPSTKILGHLFEMLSTRTYVDLRTGEIVVDYDPASSSRRVGARVSPDRVYFMTIGHLLWAMILGYFGSRFAGWIYGRRIQREKKEPTG
jgi:hypothetical protein